MIGAHNQLKAYTVATTPNTPIDDRDKPLSCNQIVKIEPWSTHGNPLQNPNSSIVKYLESRNCNKESLKFVTLINHQTPEEKKTNHENY